MKVYVAGRTKDVRRVKQVQHMVRAVGWTITFDWTTAEEEDGRFAHKRHGWADVPDLARDLALKEYHACRDADLTILLWSEDMIGAHFEAAWGLESGELWVVECPRDSIFFYLHDGIRRIENVVLCFQAIREYADKLDPRRGPDPIKMPEVLHP